MGRIWTLASRFRRNRVATFAPATEAVRVPTQISELHAVTTPKTRLMLIRAMARERNVERDPMEPLAHARGRAYGYRTVHAEVPASSLRQDAFFTDPWWSRVEVEKDEPEPSGDTGNDAKRPDGSLLISEQTFRVKLLDGREATHVRRVIKRPTGRRIKEFVMKLEDGSTTSIAKLAPILPLYAIENYTSGEHKEIVITEGVAAAAALIGMGFSAAGTLTGGLHTPRMEALRPLVQFERIYLWPDNDSVGVQHMERIADRLHTIGAKDIKVVQWRGGPHRGDAADFHEGQGGVQELLTKATSWEPGSRYRSRGQLAVRIPQMPVTLELPKETYPQIF